ncbi:FecR family protein [Chitinophaga japonensis]|nr:FecR family protein [Chitinophaga japonensis]
MDYSLYEPEDFAANESYLRYYFKLDPVDVFFWQNWIRNHPEKLDVIISADQLISFAALQLPEEEFQQEMERLQQALSAGEEQEAVAPVRTTQSRLTRLFAAAGILLGVLLATGLFFHSRYYLSKQGPAKLAAADALQEKENRGTAPLKIQLADNSIVTLQQGARLLYPRRFTPGKREVYLQGEAFFEVSHDPDRPFYVYYNNLVTHVLGTSFNIRADQRKKQVEVTVRSGKVEVYEQAPAGNRQHGAAGSNGVILTPNQKVLYSEDSRQFEALLVEHPLPLATAPAPDTALVKDAPAAVAERFVFNTAPLPEVLQAFEQVYGIEIEVENERINNCHFSGDISNMDFNARMEVICQVLHATYEIRGTKILIRGNGCSV